MTTPVAAYEYRVLSECASNSGRPAAALGASERAAFVEGFARATEVLVVVGAAVEVALERGCRIVADLETLDESVWLAVHPLCGLDPVVTLEEHVLWFKQHVGESNVPAPDTALEDIRDKLLEASRATVASETIVNTLVGWANELMIQDWGHRARSAVDGLRAYLRRHDRGSETAFANAAKMYVEGRLTIHQAAEILGIPSHDALVEFERHHFCRPSQIHALSDGERTDRLAALRKRRRAGRTPNRNRARREVLASQRIENVDARRWLKPEND